MKYVIDKLKEDFWKELLIELFRQPIPDVYKQANAVTGRFTTGALLDIAKTINKSKSFTTSQKMEMLRSAHPEEMKWLESGVEEYFQKELGEFIYRHYKKSKDAERKTD